MSTPLPLGLWDLRLSHGVGQTYPIPHPRRFWVRETDGSPDPSSDPFPFFCVSRPKFRVEMVNESGHWNSFINGVYFIRPTGMEEAV